MNRTFLIALFAPTAALAGPYDQPYSIIATDASRSADHLLRPVIVNRVDDENAMADNKAVVAPGPHKVTVDLPPRKGFHIATQHTFELVTKPCVRYNVAAKLETTAGQRWTPVVRSQEPILECEKKFKK